jgi:cysteine desulfurase
MITPDPKYFDYAASTPPYPEALKKHTEISERFYGNPSSLHLSGGESRTVFNEFKNEFCELLGFMDGRLLLCSSGTEANNTIIGGHVNQFPDGRILIAENVHDSIWFAKEYFSERVDILKLNNQQQIDPDKLIEALKPGISLLCISHVCNETGVVQDVAQLANICYNQNTRLMVDGVQAIGHLGVNMEAIPCDYYTFSSHKFGGIRGCGGILLRDTDFIPLLRGGKQEWGLRAGTENIGSLAACSEALKISIKSMTAESDRLKDLTHIMLNKLKSEVPDLIENSSERSIPGFLSLSFPGFQGSEIVTAMSLEGYSVSTGSACHANEVEPPRIILSLGRSRSEATGTIRITMGRGSTEQSVNDLSDAIIRHIR